MMLVQKPPAFALAQPPNVPSYHHRRHPSAPPSVVVQPTRTPGLLSIAKLTKATAPQRQLQANQRKIQAAQHQQNEKKQMARAPPALLNSAEITAKRPAVVALQGPVSPTPVRGRVAPKQGKERRNKQHGRQPSPPVVEDSASTPPSQAEAPISSHNQFDSLNTPKSKSTTPIAAPRAQHPPQQQHLSTSAPTRSNVRVRAKKGHSSERFPICDDMTDAGDSSEAETPPPQTPPATPLRKQAYPKVQGNGFPFNYGPASQQRKGGRQHRRSPSEGVFNMSLSSDEDVSTASDNANPLLTFARNRAQTRPPVTPPSSFSKATGMSLAAGLEKVPAPFFASSKFQNSPSPEDLPTDEPAWE